MDQEICFFLTNVPMYVGALGIKVSGNAKNLMFVVIVMMQSRNCEWDAKIDQGKWKEG